MAQINPPPSRWLVSLQRSPHSIGWDGLPHDAKYKCIHPSPFGNQCTLLQRDAIVACLKMPGCEALTCPEPAESHIGRKPGITGPICQARRSSTATEYDHGMCKPSGCINIAFRTLVTTSEDWTNGMMKHVPSEVWPHIGFIRLRSSVGTERALTELLPDLTFSVSATLLCALRAVYQHLSVTRICPNSQSDFVMSQGSNRRAWALDTPARVADYAYGL